ncbi:MAG: type II toxin-antitoxin system RelE/ParE family toxin [Candidatus Acidulodesulfobacterium ferriphilum]|uniref:Type II toxin-antitoxin system RelE/ParE family toxin n=1 Tax=Candidatus Acidulodesulfobacterium ferriphilum TaxID=2597223 RepID=A0A519BAG3_9DELT|nr:MAG: type II toxin-antitoxin system RelE/ParE family toxin [Candidatus Acidulodesulfobacterium ferriphilum]
MDYKLIWHKSALDDLKSLDISLSRKIFEKVEKYLSQDPIGLGKPLKQNFSGMFRYRYGDYRIIYIVNETEKTITILEVGHRKNIYK